jgi:SAM-dependent methyltransferase
MALWPRPPDEIVPPSRDAVAAEIAAWAGGRLPAWEAGYLEYHCRRYQDTLRLLPVGDGRRLLDVGSFPGHLSALAQARGWEVIGLNNTIEGAAPWTEFLERCRERKITILGCEVEREPFPLPTGSVDAVLLCELFEHLHLNPFHTLKEIFRALRPGGLLILTTPNLRRVETFSRLLHGWGPQPPVSRPFHELFPSLLYHRHNREYTAAELAYYLARQGKDLYDFRLDHVYLSDALDAGHEIPGVLGQRVGTVEQRLARAVRWLAPGLRGQLMARAWRSEATLVEWTALGRPEGFGPLEEDERPTQGFTRRLTFRFRVTGPEASFAVPLPPGSGPALVSLVVAHPDPGAPPLDTRWTLDGIPALRLALQSSPRPLRLHLLVPAALAARDAVRVGVTTSTWPDGYRGRDSGVHVAAEWVLVERLPTRAAVDAARARVQAAAQAEEQERCWAVAPDLHFAHARLAPRLEVGPGDDAQLGSGWFWREDWGRLGPMRWTGAHAEAYLGHARPARRVCLRVYSGDPRLGPIGGRVSVERLSAEEPPRAVGDLPFVLAPDTWAELEVPIAAALGTLRVTIEVAPLRTPRALVEGSQDDRGLGLAVKRLWLAP